MGFVSAYKMLMVFFWRWKQKLAKKLDLVRELVMALGQVTWNNLGWSCRLLRMLRKHWRKR